MFQPSGGSAKKPNPVISLIRRIWRKRQLKKVRKYNKPIGRITSIEETPDGIVVKGFLDA